MCGGGGGGGINVLGGVKPAERVVGIHTQPSIAAGTWK